MTSEAWKAIWNWLVKIPLTVLLAVNILGATFTLTWVARFNVVTAALAAEQTAAKEKDADLEKKLDKANDKLDKLLEAVLELKAEKKAADKAADKPKPRPKDKPAVQ